MEINMTNRTKLTLFYFLAIVPFVPIDYLTFNSHAWSKACEIARILLLMFFVVRMIKSHKKPSVPLALAMVYFLGCAVSTFLAGARFSTLLDGAVFLFGLTLLIEHGVSGDVDAMTDGMLLWFEILIYANILFYILYLGGYFAGSGYKWDSLLSNHDAVIRRVFPGIILGGIKAFRTKNRITPRFACMCLVFIFYLLRVRAMTPTIGMIIFMTAIFWHGFTQKYNIFKYEYFAILSVLISIQFAVLRRFSFARFFITKILKKSMTLSGRTRVWAKAINKICERPFFGYGQLSARRVREFIGFADPHNILLGVLIFGGILGLIILIFILTAYGRKIYSDRKQNRKFLFIFEAGLCACFIMWNFMTYAYIYEFSMIYILLVMAYYCKDFEKG